MVNLSHYCTLPVITSKEAKINYLYKLWKDARPNQFVQYNHVPVLESTFEHQQVGDNYYINQPYQQFGLNYNYLPYQKAMPSNYGYDQEEKKQEEEDYGYGKHYNHLELFIQPVFLNASQKSYGAGTSGHGTIGQVGVGGHDGISGIGISGNRIKDFDLNLPPNDEIRYYV